MLRSFYIATTGMLSQRSKMDVIINNITNVDTTGYKKDQVMTRSFDDLLLERLNDPSILNRNTAVGGQNTGIYVDELVTDFTQGPMEETGRQTDLAITGDGFFCVQTPEGVRYTRDGNFQVDVNGNLLTQDGYYVLGENGGMLNVGNGDFSVKSDGSIFNNGGQAGRLYIARFANNDVLRKAGGNLYYPYNGEQPAIAQNPAVAQGMLEGSNLDLGREMADMLLTNRTYESNQRILRMVDESLSKTVNDIAKF